MFHSLGWTEGAYPLDFARMVLGTYSVTSSDDIEHRILTRAPRLRSLVDPSSSAGPEKTRRKIFPPKWWVKKLREMGEPPGNFRKIQGKSGKVGEIFFKFGYFDQKGPLR